MVEYLRSVGLAGLDFYSRASSSALRVGCSLKCLPGYATWHFCVKLRACVGLFSVLWNLSEVLNTEVDLTSKYFVVEHSWPLYVYHKLCCSGGIWWWHPLRLLTTWKSGKSNAGIMLLSLIIIFFACDFFTSFIPVLQDILGLTPAFSSGLANILVVIHLVKSFRKHSLLVRSQIWGVTPGSRLETQIPSAGL